VSDWTFTTKQPLIMIETQTVYFVPDSVTIFRATSGERFYVAARNTAGKSWLENVLRNPDVRLKIGDRLYEQRLVPIEDEKESEVAYAAYVSKYGWPPTPPEQRSDYRFFEVVGRNAAAPAEQPDA
jgi:hypothetical protein